MAVVGMADRRKRPRDERATAKRAHDPRAVAGQVWRRPIVALVILGILALASFAVFQWELQAAEHQQEVIDDTGQQRTQTLRVVEAATHYVLEPDAAERDAARERMVAEKDVLVAVHRRLVASDPFRDADDRLVPEFRTVLEDPPHRLEATLAGFAEAVEKLAAADASSRGSAHPAYLAVHDQGEDVIAGYDELARTQVVRGESRVAQLQTIAFAGLAATIVMLFLTAVVAVRPIVQRVETELENLNAVNERLEMRVARRTRELEERARALERSNKELQQFAAVAAHDLQEPLRMVSSYLQLLERRYRGELDDEAREYIDYAVGGSNRMKGLIDDLLMFAQVGASGRPLTPMSLQKAYEEAVDNLGPYLQEEGAKVANGTLPRVMGDHHEIVQLFQNLIQNGVKYQAPGRTPQVHVSAEEADHTVTVRVQDNGIGIDPKYHERVFGLFQRLHSRNEYPGTGIGLAVCKKTVERHGGRIWIESDGRTGTAFLFTLPAALATGEAHVPVAQDEAGQEWFRDVDGRSRELV